LFFKRLLAIITAVAILITLSTSLYVKKGKDFQHFFKEALIEAFAEETGIELAIDSISSHPLREIVLEGVSVDLGDYRLRFDQVELEYSPWDIIAKRRLISELGNTTFKLKEGFLASRERLRICDGITGECRFAEGGITLRADFGLYDHLSNSIEGQIKKQGEAFLLDLAVVSEPLFDNKIFFSQAVFYIKGPVERMAFNGALTTPWDSNISLSGTFRPCDKGLNFFSSFDYQGLEIAIEAEGSLVDQTVILDSNVDLKDQKNAKTFTFGMDTEINLDDSNFITVLSFPEGTSTINGNYSNWPKFTTDITNAHIKIYDVDFSNITHLTCEFLFQEESFSHLMLDLSTESTILNYYPFDEAKASCYIDTDGFRLIYIKVGNSTSASGALMFSQAQPSGFLRVTVADFDIKKLSILSKELEDALAYGRFSGEIFIEGSLDASKTTGKLQAHDGVFGNIKYEDMILNFDGEGPEIRVYDSRLIREDSFLTLEGRLDIRNIGKMGFLKDVTISTDEQTIIWHGWDITKTAEDDNITLKKGLDGKVRVGFKKYMDDETTYKMQDQQDEVALEYELTDNNELLQYKAKEKEEFLGLMKKYKF